MGCLSSKAVEVKIASHKEHQRIHFSRPGHAYIPEADHAELENQLLAKTRAKQKAPVVPTPEAHTPFNGLALGGPPLTLPLLIFTCIPLNADLVTVITMAREDGLDYAWALAKSLQSWLVCVLSNKVRTSDWCCIQLGLLICQVSKSIQCLDKEALRRLNGFSVFTEELRMAIEDATALLLSPRFDAVESVGKMLWVQAPQGVLSMHHSDPGESCGWLAVRLVPHTDVSLLVNSDNQIRTAMRQISLSMAGLTVKSKNNWDLLSGFDESELSRCSSTSSFNVALPRSSLQSVHTSKRPSSHMQQSTITSGVINESTATSGFINQSAGTSGFINQSIATSGFLNQSIATSGFLNQSVTTSGFVRQSAGTSGFLNQSMATSGFLNQSVAPSGIMIQSADTSGFLNQSMATSGFLNQSIATSGFVRQSAGTSGFLNQSMATSGFLNQSIATSGFVRQSAGTSGFLNQSMATSGFVRQSAATSSFLRQSAATSSFLRSSMASRGFLSRCSASQLDPYATSQFKTLSRALTGRSFSYIKNDSLARREEEASASEQDDLNQSLAASQVSPSRSTHLDGDPPQSLPALLPARSRASYRTADRSTTSLLGGEGPARPGSSCLIPPKPVTCPKTLVPWMKKHSFFNLLASYNTLDVKRAHTIGFGVSSLVEDMVDSKPSTTNNVLHLVWKAVAAGRFKELCAVLYSDGCDVYNALRKHGISLPINTLEEAKQVRVMPVLFEALDGSSRWSMPPDMTEGTELCPKLTTAGHSSESVTVSQLAQAGSSNISNPSSVNTLRILSNHASVGMPLDSSGTPWCCSGGVCAGIHPYCMAICAPNECQPDSSSPQDDVVLNMEKLYNGRPWCDRKAKYVANAAGVPGMFFFCESHRKWIPPHETGTLSGRTSKNAGNSVQYLDGLEKDEGLTSLSFTGILKHLNEANHMPKETSSGSKLSRIQTNSLGSRLKASSKNGLPVSQAGSQRGYGEDGTSNEFDKFDRSKGRSQASNLVVENNQEDQSQPRDSSRSFAHPTELSSSGRSVFADWAAMPPRNATDFFQRQAAPIPSLPAGVQGEKLNSSTCSEPLFHKVQKRRRNHKTRRSNLQQQNRDQQASPEDSPQKGESDSDSDGSDRDSFLNELMQVKAIEMQGFDMADVSSENWPDSDPPSHRWSCPGKFKRPKRFYPKSGEKESCGKILDDRLSEPGSPRGKDRITLEPSFSGMARHRSNSLRQMLLNQRMPGLRSRPQSVGDLT